MKLQTPWKIVDEIDRRLCARGLLKGATFDTVLQRQHRALYAGRLSRYLPQFRTHIGLTPFFPSSRNIGFDITQPMPLPDNSIDAYQAEDVFEHIEFARLPPVLDEIYRVLKPGGYFRLSVPDYRFDLYRDRSLKGPGGEFLFDPGGGGSYENGKVVGGGHVWFPTFELVDELFRRSKFGTGGTVNFVQYNAPDGSAVMNPIDSQRGYVQRVPGQDARVASRPRPISIVVDAVKDEARANSSGHRAKTAKAPTS
jgi:SAM-dependent methyltransferase